MRGVTIRQLQIFAAAAGHLSFARTSEQLHLTQAAVSLQIKQLEQLAGIALFERRGRKVHLTEAGQHLLRYAQQILDALRDADAVISALKGLRGGRISVGVVSTAKYFAPALLARFHERFPGVRVTLSVNNREVIVRELERNEIDVAIMGTRAGGAARTRIQPRAAKALRIVVDSHPNIYLKIAGSGILRPKLDVLVDELRLSQQVNFLGAIPHDQMPRFFQSGDLLIHSSRHESQEIVAMEAALSGITAIGSRVGVLPDIVPEEQIVAVRDHNRLASAILRMISDRERRRQSGLAAQAIAREKYTSETSVTRLETLYQELTHEH